MTKLQNAETIQHKMKHHVALCTRVCEQFKLMWSRSYSRKIQDSSHRLTAYIQSEYCSCPGHKESLDFPRLEQEPLAPSRWRCLGLCYPCRLSDHKRTPRKQNLPRLECCYYIKRHFSAPNFRAEKLVLLLKTVPYK